VLNEDEDFERAFKLGVAGVMTDFPSKLTNYLHNHPEHQWKPDPVTMEMSEKSLLKENQQSL